MVPFIRYKAVLLFWAEVILERLHFFPLRLIARELVCALYSFVDWYVGCLIGLKSTSELHLEECSTAHAMAMAMQQCSSSIRQMVERQRDSHTHTEATYWYVCISKMT